MKFSEFAQIGKRRLQAARVQCADPVLHMRQMIDFALGGDGKAWLLRWNETVPPETLAALEAMLARREKGEPFQYITGEEWFWRSRFQVGPGVFIPRKETERLVEALVARLPARARVAELGAGSGNIGLSCLIERPDWQWHAFELSTDAARFTRANRDALLPPGASYVLHEGSFFDGVDALAPLEAIVSNPPYIRKDEMALLPVEVTHEPTLALDGGHEGLDILAQLVETGRRCLSSGGFWACEIDYRQAERVRELLLEQGMGNVEVLPDLAGLARIVVARKG